MAPQIVRVIIVVAAGCWLLQPGFGQGRGGATSSGGATGTGTTGSAGSTGTGSIGTRPSLPTSPTNPTNPSTTPQPSSAPQPIYITGRVLMEDGNPPTESVTIERVCGASPHAEGYTDSKGYFGITLGQGQSQGVIQDASELGSGRTYGDSGSGMGMPRSSLGGGPVAGGGNSEMRLMNCDLQAKLGGYRSQTVSLANHRAMDNPDIGTILLHRMMPTEGTTVSAASLMAPKDAHKAFDKGMEAARKKKWDEAAKEFQKAVEIYPGYATAWYELGRLQMASAPDSARISFECAMKADPKYAAPYVDLAGIEVQAKKWKEVAQITDRAIRLDSFDYPELFFFNAAANYYLKNSEVAEKNARRAVKLDNQHRYPQSEYLLGLLLAQRHDYAAAAEELRAYLKLAPDAEDAPAAKQKLDQIEKVAAVSAATTTKQDQ